MSLSTAAQGRKILLESISEEDWQSTVIENARIRGWRIAHFRPALDPRRGGSWRTAMDGDPGFPDLVLVKPGRLIFAELKSEKGAVSPGQRMWLDKLVTVAGAGVNVYVWRPSDLSWVLEVLAG